MFPQLFFIISDVEQVLVCHGGDLEVEIIGVGSHLTHQLFVREHTLAMQVPVVVNTLPTDWQLETKIVYM